MFVGTTTMSEAIAQKTLRIIEERSSYLKEPFTSEKANERNKPTIQVKLLFTTILTRNLEKFSFH